MLMWALVATTWLSLGLVVALGIGAMGRTNEEADVRMQVDWLLEENTRLREHMTRAQAQAQLAQAAAGELRSLLRDAHLHAGPDDDRPVPGGPASTSAAA
jgi:hypothetical protein